MTWLKNNWLFAGILFVAFLLRFIPLFSYEFSYDELNALERINYDSFSKLIYQGVVPDTHPALIQLFIFCWAKIGGTSEIWIKLPFLICGFLSCYYLYSFSFKWFGRKTALLSLVIISSSMIFLVYSSYARMYAPGVLFCILSLKYLFEIVFADSTNKRHYVLLGLFLLLSALNHHMSALLGVLLWLFGFLFSKVIQKKYLFYVAIICTVLYLPHLPITLIQTSHSIGAGEGANGWLAAPKWYAFFSFIKTLLGTGYVVYLFATLFLIGAILSKASFVIERKIVFLFLLFVSYYFIIYFYSIYKSPILQFSVLLIASPCLILLIAKGISFIPDNFSNSVVISLMLVIVFQALVMKKYFQLGLKQSNRSAVVQTIEAKKEYGENNVAAIYVIEPFFINHYLDRFNNHYKYLNVFDSTYSNSVLLQQYLHDLKENYIVLSDPDAVLLERVRHYFPYIVYHDEGYFKNIFLLTKYNNNNASDNTLVSYDIPQLSEYFIFPNANKETNIDSMNEFPYYVWAKYNELPVSEGMSIIASCSFKAFSQPGNLSLDFNVKKNDTTSLFYAGRNLQDFYLPEDSVHKGYSSIFIGSDNDEWKTSKLECFLWNHDKKRYIMDNFEIKILDINPHKYHIWD